MRGQGDWFEETLNGAGFEDQDDCTGGVILIVGDQRGEVVLFVERDDRRQGVACQGKVQCYVGPAVPMPVLLPYGVIALVVVLVFHRPVFAHDFAEPGVIPAT